MQAQINHLDHADHADKTAEQTLVSGAISTLNRRAPLRPLRRMQQGQGLVEYALLIFIVAIGAIVVLGLLSLSTSHAYAVVAGALGAKKDAPGVIGYDNNKPQCGSWSGQKMIYAQFYSSIPKSSLTVSTENARLNLVVEDNVDYHGEAGIGNYMVFYPLPIGEVCPNAFVIQSDREHGSITTSWAILQKDWN